MVLSFFQRLPAKIAMGLVMGYRYGLSPFLPMACRFQPSCSEYTVAALEKYGFFRGLWLSLRRLSKCHPYSGKSGYDPLL